MAKCFVIQPFDRGVFDRRYNDTFKPAIEEAGFEPYRVDEDPSVEIPIQDIEKGIREAAVCLAEITEDNPNVWFELGFAIASRKPVVIVCESSRLRFPFDVQHRSIIRYYSGSSSDFDTLRKKIVARLKVIPQTKSHDNLDEKNEPRLEISSGKPVPNWRGHNKLYPINITSISLSDIEECKGTLTRIVHDGRQMWGDRRADLPIAPAEKKDATNKTIRPRTTEYLDVLFLKYDQSGRVVGVEVAVQPGVWLFEETAQEIFYEAGDYFLTVDITAKATPTIKVELKFHYNGDFSTLEIFRQS